MVYQRVSYVHHHCHHGHSETPPGEGCPPATLWGFPPCHTVAAGTSCDGNDADVADPENSWDSSLVERDSVWSNLYIDMYIYIMLEYYNIIYINILLYI